LQSLKLKNNFFLLHVVLGVAVVIVLAPHSESVYTCCISTGA